MNNPSTIGHVELLTVHFPDLEDNQVIIPRTMKLTFNISDVNRTLVKNLGLNIVRNLVFKLKGNEVLSIDDYDYDVLFTYILTAGNVQLRGLMLSFKV